MKECDMLIDVAWDNEEHTIIRVTFPEVWSWDDFLSIDSIIGEMLDTINHKVCYLADVRQTTRLPQGLELETARQVLDFTHENSDLLVIVGMNTMIQALLNIVLMALGRIDTRIKILDNIDDAYNLINNRLLEIKRYGG